MVWFPKHGGNLLLNFASTVLPASSLGRKHLRFGRQPKSRQPVIVGTEDIKYKQILLMKLLQHHIYCITSNTSTITAAAVTTVQWY